MNCEALSKERWEIRDGDLLEIFPPEDQETWRSGCVLVHRLSRISLSS